MDWLALALLSAFALASADAATKHWLADYRAAELVVIRFGVGGLLLAPALLLQPWPALPPAFWGWVAALVPLEFAAMWLYMRAIRTSPLALTVPYLAFTPVFVTLTGYLLLGERVSPAGFVGILLVAVGAYVLNAQKLLAGGAGALWAPVLAVWREPGSRAMLGVAVLYAVTSVLGKGALQYAPPSFFGPFYFALLALITLAFTGWRRSGALLARRPGPHLLVGAAMAVMVIGHFLAVERVEVAYMIAVKRTSLLFGILYGALLFRETGLVRHLAGGTLMVAGVFLVAR